MRDTPDHNTQPIGEGAWFKSTFSGGGSGSECVEVARLVGGAAIRDSKNKTGAVLRFNSAGMAAFVNSLKGGESDTPA